MAARLAVLLAILLVTPPARAETFTTCSVAACDLACACDPCAVPALGTLMPTLGLFGGLGASSWPTGGVLGGAFLAGIRHNRTVGGELSFAIPENGFTTRDGRFTATLAASLRVAPVRLGLDRDWLDGGAPPDFGLVLGARVGLGLTDEGAAFVAGGTLELVLYGWLLVALRPSVVALPIFRGEGVFDALPWMELVLGLTPGAYPPRSETGLGAPR